MDYSDSQPCRSVRSYFDELVDIVKEDGDGHQRRHQIDPKRGGPPIDAPRIPPVMPTTVSAMTASQMTTTG